jgi:hypothetical protein
VTTELNYEWDDRCSGKVVLYMSERGEMVEAVGILRIRRASTKSDASVVGWGHDFNYA